MASDSSAVLVSCSHSYYFIKMLGQQPYVRILSHSRCMQVSLWSRVDSRFITNINTMFLLVALNSNPRQVHASGNCNICPPEKYYIMRLFLYSWRFILQILPAHNSVWCCVNTGTRTSIGSCSCNSITHQPSFSSNSHTALTEFHQHPLSFYAISNIMKHTAAHLVLTLSIIDFLI